MWAPHAERRARELHARAVRAMTMRRSSAWYLARERALRVPTTLRAALCGKTPVIVECRCGRREVPDRCGLRWLCSKCKRRTYNRIRARLARALRTHAGAARRAWLAEGRPRGGERRVTMATLTVAHSGNLAADRETLRRGWQLLRQWLHRRIGKFVFALAWEVTPGLDGNGHVHAHVACLLPFVDWSALHEEWTRATDGRSSHIDLRSQRMGTRDAALYVAKYASKGVEVADWTPEFSAHVLDATYGKRLVSTSHGFWLKEPERRCECCGARPMPVEFPGALDVPTPVWLTHRPCVIWLEPG